MYKSSFYLFSRKSMYIATANEYVKVDIIKNHAAVPFKSCVAKLEKLELKKFVSPIFYMLCGSHPQMGRCTRAGARALRPIT